ncbi:hypothetical protein AB1I63_09770 [Streptococcus pneumoniae]
MNLRFIWVAVEPDDRYVIGLSESEGEARMVYVKVSESEWERFKERNYIQIDGDWYWDFHGENGDSPFIDFYDCQLIDNRGIYSAESWERKPYVEGELDG